MKNLVGKKYDRLQVIEQAEYHITPNGTKFPQWLCKCDCNNTIIVNHYSLIRGLTKSCGCLNSQLVKQRNKNCKKNNIYDLSGTYGIGYTSKGESFLFDLEDYLLIKDYCWFINDGYVCARDSKTNTSIKMHNLIMHRKYDIDHRNHNKSDNQKNNLRVTTRSQNQMNSSIKSNNKSGVTGVSFDKEVNKWIAYITVNRKQIKLGRFVDFDDAVKSRKEAEDKYFGEYSYNNSMNNNQGG